MKKISTLLILILFFSCRQKPNRIDFEKEFRNQTFNLVFKEDQDTVAINFRDSTFTIYDYDEKNLPWGVSIYNDSDFIILNKSVVGLDKANKNVIKGILINKNNTELIFEKRKKLWNKKMLNGIWVEEKYIDLNNNSGFKLPPPPPSSNTLDEFQYQPYYQIKDDTILSRFHYQKSKSTVDINNTAEFLSMDLQSDFDKVDILWEIKELNDSIMVIDRKIKKEEHKFNFLTTTEKNIKLIKKR